MINNQLLSLLRNIILHSIFSWTNAVSLNKFSTETPTEGKINIYIHKTPDNNGNGNSNYNSYSKQTNKQRRRTRTSQGRHLKQKHRPTTWIHPAKYIRIYGIYEYTYVYVSGDYDCLRRELPLLAGGWRLETEKSPFDAMSRLESKHRNMRQIFQQGRSKYTGSRTSKVFLVLGLKNGGNAFSIFIFVRTKRKVDRLGENMRLHRKQTKININISYRQIKTNTKPGYTWLWRTLNIKY